MKKNTAMEQEERRSITPALNEDQIIEIENFFESCPPRELRENLLEYFITYLIYVHGTLPIDFEKMAMNMYGLLQLLQMLDETLEYPLKRRRAQKRKKSKRAKKKLTKKASQGDSKTHGTLDSAHP